MGVAPGGDIGSALQVFREPVITPSGLSYEQSALQEHLSKVRFPRVSLPWFLYSSISAYLCILCLLRMVVSNMGLNTLIASLNHQQSAQSEGMPASKHCRLRSSRCA